MLKTIIQNPDLPARAKEVTDLLQISDRLLAGE